MNEALFKVDEIIAYLKNSKEYKHYLELRECMANNQEINGLLEKVRNLQKMIANYPQKKDELTIKLDFLNKELLDIPLYRDYMNTLDDINNVLNIIETSINKYFSDKLN